jgi:chromosome segregation ATPase
VVAKWKSNLKDAADEYDKLQDLQDRNRLLEQQLGEERARRENLLSELQSELEEERKVPEQTLKDLHTMSAQHDILLQEKRGLESSLTMKSDETLELDAKLNDATEERRTLLDRIDAMEERF